MNLSKICTTFRVHDVAVESGAENLERGHPKRVGYGEDHRSDQRLLRWRVSGTARVLTCRVVYMFDASLFFIAHLSGDYLLQSDWMAQKKTSSWLPAVAHALVYSLPYLVMRPTLVAWLVIVVTHAAIDHYRLARYVCWGKNFLAPRWIEVPREPVEIPPYEVLDRQVSDTWKPPSLFLRNYPWSDCVKTGYYHKSPDWLAFWLLFIADNTMHLICNYVALRFL